MKTLLLVALIGTLVAGLAFAGGRNERGTPRSGSPAAGTSAELLPREPLSSDELQAIIAANDGSTLLVDVRTAQEYAAGYIPSAVNIPFDLIEDNLPTEDRSARIIVYCRSGTRSGTAARTLAALGFTNVLDFGGIGRWDGKLLRL